MRRKSASLGNALAVLGVSLGGGHRRRFVSPPYMPLVEPKVTSLQVERQGASSDRATEGCAVPATERGASEIVTDSLLTLGNEGRVVALVEVDAAPKLAVVFDLSPASPIGRAVIVVACRAHAGSAREGRDGRLWGFVTPRRRR